MLWSIDDKLLFKDHYRTLIGITWLNLLVFLIISSGKSVMHVHVWCFGLRLAKAAKYRLGWSTWLSPYAELRVVFDNLDQNTDGYVSLKEILNTIRSLGLKGDNQKVEECFHQVDTDGN